MPLRLEEFQKEAITAYVNNSPAQREYLLRGLMPEDRSYDINFAYNVINGRFAEAASITGWNASAPLRDKRSLEQAFGEVAKVQHGQRLDEKELLAFNRPRSDAERAAVIDYIYDLTDELSAGVDDIEEYMRAQALYNGVLRYDDDVNDIHIDVDFGVPAENKITATTLWDAAGATPLADLQAAVRQFQSQNSRRKPQVIHMNSATEAILLQNEQIRTQVYGTDNGGRLLTANDVQNAFTALGLPNYVINDDVVMINGEETPLLADRKVVLLGADLGRTVVGPTIESGYEPTKFVEPKIMQDPPGQAVIVGKAVFPALQRPQGIVTLTV